MIERMSVRQLRDNLGRRVQAAHSTGEHTIVEKYGETQAVLVPYAWWAEQQERAGQGTLAP
jgi:antitoxin (DNA-binding transcriptional repressor) of toxin-antitoxin stability system